MPHYELPIGAFISAALVLVPLPWHWRARNITTLSMIAWLFIFNFTYGVNAIIWAGNVRLRGTIWCDIVTKLQIGGNIALPACCLALCINLESIASLRNAHTTPASKRRKLFLELGFCWILPMIYMVLHYVVQGHRYDIVEDFGCRPTTYNSVASIFLIWVPPMLCVVVTLILASLCLYHFFRRRVTFSRHLANSASGLTTSRYFRLIAMSIVQMFWGIAIMSFNMWFTLRTGLRPWISWADVHSDWHRIDAFRTIFIPKQVVLVTHVLWWTIPVSTWLFFVFFSFGEDAVKEYKRCGVWIKERVFRMKNSGSEKDSMKGWKGLSFVKPLSSTSKPKPKLSMLPISNPVLQSITHLEYTLPPYDTLYKNAGTFGTVSSVEQASTTLHGHTRSESSSSNDTHVSNEFEYKYKLRDSRSRFTDNFTTSPTRHSFKFAQPKAIGSYSDLSIYSPSSSTVMSPSSTVIGSSESSPKKMREDLDDPVSPLTNYVTSHPQEYYAPQAESQRRVPSPSLVPVVGRVTRSPAASITVPEPIREPVHAPTSAGSRLRPLLLGQGWESWRPVTHPSHEAETWSVDTTERQS
ncbi:STE3-domain-containing protein [Coprinellus micaceus]|uniref:STE3-domain-containing protein n=1 Tax=Coprinellus micaceus TaxID=71717 RepID=A0A4Y7SME9_COPMI|nr:STE3-domain-containing protein [Coprinellus micaceus]